MITLQQKYSHVDAVLKIAIINNKAQEFIF